ncbi:hypothetical protein SALBM311S_12731 [Streptomyces alboniger]
MPVTEVPDLVTWYVTVAPLQKWKVRVTREPSLSALKNSGVSLTASLVYAENAVSHCW